MELVDPDDLISISGPDNIMFLTKVSVYFGLIACGLYVVLFEPINAVVGMLILGLAFAHGVELQHQALHGSGFSNPMITRVIGFILGLPLLVSYSSYQYLHFVHHDKVGTKDDTEFFEFNTLSKESSIFVKLSSFFLFPHYREFFRRTIKSLRSHNIIDKCDIATCKKVRSEYLLMALIIGTWSLASIYYQNFLILYVWLIPLLVVAAPIHSLIELPEHFGCNNKSENILENTRTIKSNFFLTWFTNGNNYHVEHHMYPLVRPEKARAMSKILTGKIRYYNNTYCDFFFGKVDNDVEVRS